MTDDHIAVKIDGVIYVKLDDVKPMRARIEKLELVEKAYQQNQQTWSRNIARIEKLEAALRVYADEDHWFGDKFEPIMFPEGECKCCYEHFSDQGEIARKALEGKDE